MGQSSCPFDNLPCDHVDSCDDVLALQYHLVPPIVCSRAVLVAGGRKK